MRALVPFVEHGRDVAFPVLAPGAVVTVVSAVAHSAEEHHFHEAEEEEQEEDGTADGAEWEEAKVMTVSAHTIAVSVR